MDYKKLSRIVDSVKKVKDSRAFDYRQRGGSAKEVFKDTDFNDRGGGNEFTENSFTLPGLGKIAHKLALSGAKWFCSTPEEVECYVPDGMVAFIGYETPIKAYFHKGVGPEDYVEGNSTGEEISLSKAYKLCGIASGSKTDSVKVQDPTNRVSDSKTVGEFLKGLGVLSENGVINNDRLSEVLDEPVETAIGGTGSENFIEPGETDFVLENVSPEEAKELDKRTEEAAWEWLHQLVSPTDFENEDGGPMTEEEWNSLDEDDQHDYYSFYQEEYGPYNYSKYDEEKRQYHVWITNVR